MPSSVVDACPGSTESKAPCAMIMISAVLPRKGASHIRKASEEGSS